MIVNDEMTRINPKLTDYELRIMKINKSKCTKLKRFIFKNIHKISLYFKIKRLSEWSYIKWLNTYADDPIGFWIFAGDYLDCKFSKDDLIIGD